MGWRRGIGNLLILTLALAILLPSALAAEIDSEIYTQLGQNSQVSIIIEYKNPSDIKISGVDIKSLESDTVFSATVSSSKLQQLRQDPNVKAILINIFGGIVRCDRVAQGVVDAYKNMGDAIKVPIIVRLQGTNAAIAKELIDNSGMPILSAVEFQEAADQVKAALS